MSTAEVEWIRTDERFPHDGAAVLGAATGRYPDGKEFWIVLPMHFRRVNHDEEAGGKIENCFVDSDDVLREALGGDSAEQITHWTEYPFLPGTSVQQITGAGVPAALEAADRA